MFPSPSPQRRTLTFALAALLVMTTIGVSISTASDISLDAPPPASQALSVDERSYYEFVAPRLDRLVVEVDEVVTMVDGKSRDIIALTVHGDRIEELTDEIVTFGEEHGIPPRFDDVHGLIVSGTDTVTYTFGEARLALRRFNFSKMTTLVSEFDAAAQTLHRAQDQMMTVVGITPAQQHDRT